MRSLALGSALLVWMTACGSESSRPAPAPPPSETATASPVPAPAPARAPEYWTDRAASTEAERASLVDELLTIAHQQWMPDDADAMSIGGMEHEQSGAAGSPITVPVSGNGCVFIAGQVTDASGAPTLAPATLTLGDTEIAGDTRLDMGFSLGYGRPVCAAARAEGTLAFEGGPFADYWLRIYALPEQAR